MNSCVEGVYFGMFLASRWRQANYPNDIWDLGWTGKKYGGMMMSWHWNPLDITGPLCGESTGDQWIPLTKGQSSESFTFSGFLAWTSCWINRPLHWNAINNYSPFVRGIHWAVTERCSCRCSLFFQWVFGIFRLISASIGLMQMVDNFLVVCWSNLMVHLGNRCQVQVWF